MCFCRRKTSQREEAIDSSRRGDNSRKQCRDQPLAAPQNQMGQQQLQQQNQQQSARHANHNNNNNQEKRGEKKGKKEKTVPRGKGLTKKRGRRTREDDTISNIPDEMPDLEITREHAEPFYTDEQLM